jgi:hypothetical protein
MGAVTTMAERHLDRRALLRAILLGAAGAAGTGVLAACGLPSSSRPIIDGPGLSGRGSGDSPVKAPVPEDAFDPVTLVQKFFGAVAGRVRLDADISLADQRAQAFLTPQAKKAWQGGGQITVVRKLAPETQANGESGSTLVEVQVQPIGLLGRWGTVDELPLQVSPEPRTLGFVVVPNGGRSQYLIDRIEARAGSPLPGMMLDVSNLTANLYTPQLIYFWSAETRSDGRPKGLVPDLRYLPLAGLSQVIQLTEIVSWVLNGPSDLLKDSVQSSSAYAGVSIVGPNLTAPDRDGLLINLNPAPQGVDPTEVMAQMRWSLRPKYEDPVRLQYGSQPQAADGSSTEFRSVNLADENNRPPAARFCVVDGVVRNADDPTNAPGVLSDPAANKDVKLGALHRSLAVTALVKTDRQLHIGDARGTGKPAFTVAQLAGQTWTRPAFLPVADPLVLVGLDGGLFVVTPDGKPNQLVTGFPVSAFAVAPDGHRIGVISNGRVLVCGLKINDGKISLGAPRQIDAGLTDYTGIAWTGLDRVLVAGRSGNFYPLVEVSIDGVVVDQWFRTFQWPVTSVVALPPLAWDSSVGTSGTAMVQANGAFNAHFSYTEPFQLAATPTPTPSASGAPTSPGSPQNPFYVD